MLKVVNKTARMMTLNLMVKGSATAVSFIPGKQETVKDKALASAIKSNAYFKANVEAGNLSFKAGGTAEKTAEEKTTYKFEDVESFLQGNVDLVSERATTLSLEQLQEAITAEEDREEREGEKPRKTLLKALVKAAEALAE